MSNTRANISVTMLETPNEVAFGGDVERGQAAENVL
ncbi:MAG: hypothetical protein ACI87E_001693 [Mariniblastus sp.]|jgi:hypothetical protein